MLDPGKMVHRISILQETTVSDISGTAAAWTPFVTTWAQIDPVRGIDVLKAGQDTTQLYLTVKIRWQTGIMANMRVQTLNGIYVIQAVENPGERSVILVLNCLALSQNQ
jgi:SPP1 family predicted phage head-tail adaptor